MPYVTEDYYWKFGGEPVYSADFPSLCRRAGEIIEEMTLYRVSEDRLEQFPEAVQKRIQDAVCAEIEYLDANGVSDRTTGRTFRAPHWESSAIRAAPGLPGAAERRSPCIPRGPAGFYIPQACCTEEVDRHACHTQETADPYPDGKPAGGPGPLGEGYHGAGGKSDPRPAGTFR